MNHRVAVLIAAITLLPHSAAAQSGANILLVVNSNSPQSLQIAEHYAKVRRVPDRNIVRIQTSDADAISRDAYESTIEEPLVAWIARQRLQDDVLYLVLTKGVPLRVDGSGGVSGTVASVDSELTLLYRKMTDAPVPVIGRLDNPFFLGDRPIATATRFSRQTSDLYLVTRLDGFTVDEVIKLIDRGVNPSRDGQIVLDQKATLVDQLGDAWLAEAAGRLIAMNHGSRVQLESTRAVAATTSPVLGYFSWGSNDPANQRRRMGLPFAPGAIGGMFVNTDARTFREPGAGWLPVPPGSATGGPSLIGDLIREGITGVSGHVAEPLLDAVIRPQVLFPAYLSGFNLAESFYLAMPYLSWQGVVIGDPLCSPFATSAAAQALVGMDPDTDLPAFFSARRLEIVKSPNLKLEGLKLRLKADNLKAQGRPLAEVHAVLAQATAVEPRLIGAQLQLAQAAADRNDTNQAILRYRAVVAANQSHIVGLNNLAQLLADREDGAKEALPLAQRAYGLSGEAALVGDTLGWVHFKLGNMALALPLLDRSARLEPGNVDVLVHAATAHASVNGLAQARLYLDAALKIDPKAGERPDVKALVARIR